MQPKTIAKPLLAALLALTLTQQAAAQAMDETSQASLDTVMALMGAMGSGDMETMGSLMADDMVWHNEGDTAVPWIGGAEGRENVFDLLGKFSAGFQTTLWQNEDAFALGDTVAVFGRMNGILTETGQETGEFTVALRAKVRDGQVVLWNWFEDSYAVSEAYHGDT